MKLLDYKRKTFEIAQNVFFGIGNWKIENKKMFVFFKKENVWHYLKSMDKTVLELY